MIPDWSKPLLNYEAVAVCDLCNFAASEMDVSISVEKASAIIWDRLGERSKEFGSDESAAARDFLYRLIIIDFLKAISVISKRNVSFLKLYETYYNMRNASVNRLFPTKDGVRTEVEDSVLLNAIYEMNCDDRGLSLGEDTAWNRHMPSSLEEEKSDNL